MTLANKIAAASKTVGGRINADKTNTDAHYDYVSADAILAFGGQALAEQGIAIVPMLASLEVTPTAYTNSRGEAKIRYDALASFIMRISDGETDQEAPWFGLGSDYTVPDKAAYKAITSGHKYFLAKMLNIGAGNEDGEHENGEEGAATAGKVIVGRQQTPTEIRQRQDGPAPTCPKCKGPMWDNRESKTNPKQPDFKCKNKECDGAIWPPRKIEPEPNRPEPMDDNSITDTDFAKLISAQDERDAPQAVVRPPKTMERPRLARIIGNPGFPAYATPFVKDFPSYANKQGVFDTEHIQARAFQLGFAVIDVSNIAAVFAALREYATEQAALPKE